MRWLSGGHSKGFLGKREERGIQEVLRVKMDKKSTAKTDTESTAKLVGERTERGENDGGRIGR